MDTFTGRLNAVAKALVGEGKRFRFEADLCKEIGINQAHWGKFKAGDRLPGAEMLSRFTKLGVNLHWLLGGGDPALMFLPPTDAEIERIAAQRAWEMVGAYGLELVRLAAENGGIAPPVVQATKTKGSTRKKR